MVVGGKVQWAEVADELAGDWAAGGQITVDLGTGDQWLRFISECQRYGRESVRGPLETTRARRVAPA